MRKLIFVTVFGLTSCLPKSDFDSGLTAVEKAPPCNAGFCTVTAEVTQTAYESKNFEYDFTTGNAGPTFFVANDAAWMTLDTAGTKITGVPTGIGTLSNILISIYDGTNTEQIGPFNVDVIGDPLAKYAWHLSNTGQRSFSTGAAKTGQDINLEPVVAENILGTGLRIAVSDTGVEVAHEDLSANESLGESRHYGLASPWLGDPTPTDPDDGHGTSVAGLIAAIGWNSLGSRGVAPGAKFAGFKFLGESSTTAKWIDQADHDFDIYNYSYGYDQCSFFDVTGLDAYTVQVETAVSTFRGGKGAIYVKSAGNDYISDLSYCVGALPPGQYPFFGNANTDQSNTLPQQIMVGAINSRGVRSSYSSPGANIWVSAPGGEYGDDAPAMITTDMEGCTNGLSESTNTTNTFDKGTSTLNTSCNYTSTMNGTSSAAPVTSGVVALILEANPNLTWREVKHILATTADVVNATAGNTTHPWSYNLSGHIYQQGWVQNAAGYKFHNWYGFGRVNAGAAVAAAQAFTASLPEFKNTQDNDSAWYYSKTDGSAIPDRSSTGVASTITSVHNFEIEAVQVKVAITHPYVSDIGLELTSPSGTKSILMNINSQIADEDMIDVVFLTNAFYGESSRGDWKLKVIDGESKDTGTLDNWSLNIFGHVDAERSDTTPTGAPTIATPADGLPNASLTATPTVTWGAVGGDVMRYEIAIGTAAGLSDVLGWESVGTNLTKSRTGQAFIDGNTYYFSVRAIDTSENVSPASSVSWIADI